MTGLRKIFSPRSGLGSTGYSILVHLTIFLAVTWWLAERPPEHMTSPEFVDLDYQVLDAPPVPVKQEQMVRRSAEPEQPPEEKMQPDNTPKEMQDASGDVAGTQKAVKENNVGSENQGTAVSTPYYKIKPKYPKAALISGTEGWVLLQIDITESGEVENVRVVDGEQKNMFQSEARRAVSQWKYRPFLDPSGKPQRKTDYQVRVDFHLRDEEAGG